MWSGWWARFQPGLSRPEGHETLSNYYLGYINLARANKVNFILESATWRASRDWGVKLGYDIRDLRKTNRAAISMLGDLRNKLETDTTKMVISGCIGPRGNGYDVAGKMTAREAKQYHLEQIGTLSETEADMVSALTINTSEEAVGITQAAESTGIPVVISFTVETDGRLPSGQGLGEAIRTVDKATENGPAYYMINCAHPSHLKDALNADEPWLKRIRGIRANASAKSHAELDEAAELDDGDPADFGARYAALKGQLPYLSVFGGCCGTDHRHLKEICRAVILN